MGNATGPSSPRPYPCSPTHLELGHTTHPVCRVNRVRVLVVAAVVGAAVMGMLAFVPLAARGSQVALLYLLLALLSSSGSFYEPGGLGP